MVTFVYGILFSSPLFPIQKKAPIHIEIHIEALSVAFAESLSAKMLPLMLPLWFIKFITLPYAI